MNDFEIKQAQGKFLYAKLVKALEASPEGLCKDSIRNLLYPECRPDASENFKYAIHLRFKRQLQVARRKLAPSGKTIVFSRAQNRWRLQAA